MLNVEKQESSEPGVMMHMLKNQRGDTLLTIFKRKKDLRGLEPFGPWPMEVSINGSSWIPEPEFERLMNMM